MNTKMFCMAIWFMLMWAIHAQGVDHTRPVMEPYQLAGKRLVFTNWFYVRTGHFDWVDEKRESVFTSTTTKMDGYEARFVPFDYPVDIDI